jgi:4-hydroxy-tetrahydrodipicolinate reductase
MKVAVLGAEGRMGAETCRAVDAAEDLALVARIGRGGNLNEATSAGAEVVVDFTEPRSVMANIAAALDRKLNIVVGTSGFDEERLGEVKTLTDGAPGVGCIIAPNFAIGAVLMVKFAREASRYFDSAEIVETHHNRKLDAPSGTAIYTAREIAAARAAAGRGPSPDATTVSMPGARGANVDDVPIHALRLAGAVAHQEVVLGGPGEILTIRHDSLDRAAFMPGVLLAVRSVADRPGLTVGIETLLGLDG